MKLDWLRVCAEGQTADCVGGIQLIYLIAVVVGIALVAMVAQRSRDLSTTTLSLMPVANGQGGYPMLSFQSRYELGHAGRIAHWKATLMAAGNPRIYNMAKDREEQKDLYGTAHIGTRVLLDPMWILRQWNVEWKKSQWGNAAAVSNRFAADLGE